MRNWLESFPLVLGVPFSVPKRFTTRVPSAPLPTPENSSGCNIGYSHHSSKPKKTQRLPPTPRDSPQNRPSWGPKIDTHRPQTRHSRPFKTHSLKDTAAA